MRVQLLVPLHGGYQVITPAASFVMLGWSVAIGALDAPWCYATVEAVNWINLVDNFFGHLDGHFRS